MSQSPVTQAQRHFIINNAYKRSRRYFDIVKLNHLEHQQQVQRRMPSNTKETIESRVGESFISSDQLLQDKVNNDLHFFHKKQDSDETETNYTARTYGFPLRSKAKTVDMRKMLARSDYDHSKVIYRNEEQFNNYYETHNRPRMSLDFQKLIGRKKQQQRYSEDPEVANGEKVSKVYQKLLFDQGNYSCFVDFKKNGKTKPKPIVDESPAYEPSKIRKGESLTHRNPFAQQLEFYQGSGMSEPCQLDNRIIKENQYFWRGVREERERLKDFAANKRKEDQQRKKIEDVLARRKPVDDRTQMCDQRFFRRNH